jgi:CheY-like chemotaxis protein
MLSDKRVLVVEADFLVAIDMQRMLEEFHAASVVFARSLGEVAQLPDRFAEFDLTIIDFANDRTAATTLVRRLIEAGSAVVVSSADAAHRRGVPGLDGVAVLQKPFGEVDLLTACTMALAATPER